MSQLITPTSSTPTPSPTPAPVIGASPTSVSFTAQQGGGNPATQVLTISNTGGGTLTWTASDDATWLTLSPASGTGPSAVTLTAATGSLTTGTYTAAITLSATGATSVTVPVTFTVTAAPVPPAIGASPTRRYGDEHRASAVSRHHAHGARVGARIPRAGVGGARHRGRQRAPARAR